MADFSYGADAGWFPASEYCPRCHKRLYAIRDDARRCPACKYLRAPPEPDSKRVAIYGEGAFKVYRKRIDHLLQNVKLGSIVGGPTADFAIEYALYREVNCVLYSSPPKIFVETVDLFIGIGPSDHLNAAVDASIPHRLLRSLLNS